MTQTGLTKEELLAGLAASLPDAIDKLTPEGRVPEQELDHLDETRSSPRIQSSFFRYSAAVVCSTNVSVCSAISCRKVTKNFAPCGMPSFL